MQSYFTTQSRVDYFRVTREELDNRSREVPLYPIPLSQPEKDLFLKLEKDFEVVKGDLEEQASCVYNIKDLRSERVP